LGKYLYRYNKYGTKRGGARGFKGKIEGHKGFSPGINGLCNLIDVDYICNISI
jgi:hypothetical protein